MKKYLLFLLPLFTFAQNNNDYSNVMILTNTLRNFDVVESLPNDPVLNEEAKAWAEHLANEVRMGYGIYDSDSINPDVSVILNSKGVSDPYTEAIWAFLMLADDPFYYRKKIVNFNAKSVGFGHAYVNDKVIIVAKWSIDE